jgi:hypothetical protein
MSSTRRYVEAVSTKEDLPAGLSIPGALQFFATIAVASRFPRFRICSISTTIGIDRSIFKIYGRAALSACRKKTVCHVRAIPTIADRSPQTAHRPEGSA